LTVPLILFPFFLSRVPASPSVKFSIILLFFVNVIYLTVRNLLEIPLPKWADENHGKHDVDDHNQEGKCDGISPVAFKTDRNHNSLNTNTPDGKTGNKRNIGSQPEEKSNVTKPDSKLVGNKSCKINDGNRTVISKMFFLQTSSHY
jgi:hypothetical protein